MYLQVLYIYCQNLAYPLLTNIIVLGFAQLVRLLSDSSVHVRKAGMKSLASIAAVDPDILSRVKPLLNRTH